MSGAVVLQLQAGESRKNNKRYNNEAYQSDLLGAVSGVVHGYACVCA